MRETGIIRHMDELGRVVFPKEIRISMNINHGDLLEIFTVDDMVCFRKYYEADTCASLVEAIIKKLDNEARYIDNVEDARAKLTEALDLLSREKEES